MKRVDMPVDVIGKSYCNFRDMFFPGSEGGKGFHYWQFLGLKEPWETMNSEGNWCLPEDAARKAYMLAGPHYKAVAKAMLLNGATYQRTDD